MTPVHFVTLSAAIGALLALAVCAVPSRKGPPSEQEIHAADSRDARGPRGLHPYRCDDNRPLLVDFRDDGLTLEMRRDAGAVPLVLTSPGPGQRYTGDGTSATVTAGGIRIEAAGKRPILCRKEAGL